MRITLYCSSVEIKPNDTYSTIVELEGVSEADIVNEVGVSHLLDTMGYEEIAEYFPVDDVVNHYSTEEIVDAIGINKVMEAYDLIERGDKEALKDFSSEDLMKEALDIK